MAVRAVESPAELQTYGALTLMTFEMVSNPRDAEARARRIKSLLQLFGGSGARLTAPSEALGIRSFFLTPSPSSPTGR